MKLLIAAVIIGGIILWIYLRIKESNKIKSVLANLADFNSQELYESCVVGKTAISIDKLHKKICFIYDTGGKGKRTSVFGHQDIYECEILTDGEVYLKSSTTRTIAGYAIGGALGGIAGAVVGGLSGSKTQKTKIKSLKLSVRVNDLNRPQFTVLFLNKEVDKSSSEYSSAMKKAQHWHGMISNLISIANNEVRNEVAQQVHSPSNNSVSEEIIKLKGLLDQGIITSEQFELQKSKLLS